MKGTFITVRQTCDHCGYIWVWKLSAILFSGSTPRKIFHFLKCLNEACITNRTFHPANILGLYVHSSKQGPYTIVFTLKNEQFLLMKLLQEVFVYLFMMYRPQFEDSVHIITNYLT